MSNNQGKFVWYDLMTTDLAAAEAFYKTVVGWEVKDSGMPDRKYLILSAEGTMVGGLMPLPDKAKAAGEMPGWKGYVEVDDVDVYADRVKAAGGSLCKPAEDIPGIGRFAVVADPHGAVFILFHTLANPPEKESSMGKRGQIGWHELHAGDREADFKFYSDLFGWTKNQAMDMGPVGIYQLFNTGGSEAVGGMMTRTPQTPHPFWLYYFTVKGIDAAVERIKQAGGKIANGPCQVPGDAWVVQCFDPQGAMFALVGSK